MYELDSSASKEKTARIADTGRSAAGKRGARGAVLERAARACRGSSEGALALLQRAKDQFGEPESLRDLMLQPFLRKVAAIWPKAGLLAPTGTALSGAELLARSNPPPMFEDLLHVFGLPPHRP